MKYGLAFFPAHYAIRPDELAREAEARGFESLWFPEHTHIPVDRLDPKGGRLPDHYWSTFDPFVALMAAAAATTTLRLATGICLVIQRDPITTAKEVASLDVLSNGRFDFGIGAGWKREEIENHHADYGTRFRRMREHIAVMKEIWTKEEPTFEGEFTSFKPMVAFPKPLQKPYPPIHLGGHGPKVLDRVVDFCDGWLPIAGFVEDFKAEVADLHRRAEAAGRDAHAIDISVFFAPAEEAAIEALGKAGAKRVLFNVPSEGRDKVLPLLDELARLIPQHENVTAAV